MGLFSNFFKSKPPKTFQSHLGLFTLVYSKRNKHLWSATINQLNLSIQGTEDQPNVDQIKFLENLSSEVEKLDNKITNKFKREFKEANQQVDFAHWKERFIIVGAEVMTIFNNEAYWNITFEDLKEPYYHFNLFIEGESFTDFSIDS